MWASIRKFITLGEEASPAEEEERLIQADDYVHEEEFPRADSELGLQVVERVERARKEHEDRKKAALYFYEDDMTCEVNAWLADKGNTSINMTYMYSEKPIYRDLRPSTAMWIARCVSDTVCLRINLSIRTGNAKIQKHACTDTYITFELVET